MPETRIKTNQKSNSGFTLIELLVVISIMGILLTLVLVDLAGQKTLRSIKIAQNELVTNLRKIQSYTLSSRSINNGQSVQYYIMKFDLNKPTQYTIQAIYNVSTPPMFLQDIETIQFPSGIRLASSTPFIKPILISRSKLPASQSPTDCALIAIAAPFGKILTNDSCSPNPLPNNPFPFNNTDIFDYDKFVNFVANINCDVNSNPFGCTASSDSTMTVTLGDDKNTINKSVVINGITGSITAQ